MSTFLIIWLHSYLKWIILKSVSYITSGAGADQLGIAVAETPSSPNIVTDYNPTEDVIGIAGLGIGFEQLNLTNQGDDVLVQTADRDLATFQGINADSLNADNFVVA